MLKLKNQQLLIWVAVLFFISSMAYAQDTTTAGEDDSSDDYMLEVVLVTATKTGATKLQETPISITAFGEEDLKKTSSFNLTDLADFAPNVNVWTVAGDSAIYIRGVGNRSTGILQEPNVGVYVDGVYMERGFAASMADFVDVERVEILRGPQGTLYGRNSTGGAMNIITKAPSDEFEATLVGEIASFSKVRFDAGLSGPIVEDKLSGRLTVSNSEWDGFYNIVSGPTEQGNEFNSIRGSLDFKVNDTFDIVLRGDYQESINHTPIAKTVSSDNPAYSGSLALTADDFYAITIGTTTDRVQKNYGLSGHITWNLPSDMTFRSISAYRIYEADHIFDGDGTDLKGVETHDLADVKSFSQELQLNGSYGDISWLAGAYYYKLDDEYGQDFADHSATGFDPLVALRYYPRPTNETDAYAVFTNLRYQIMDQFSLGGGIRYSYEKKIAVQNAIFIEVGMPPSMGIPPFAVIPYFPEEMVYDDSWEQITPTINGEFKITEDAMIYASISNGFRSGSYFPFNTRQGKEAKIEPEINWTGELGIKSDWLDNRIRFNLAGVYTIYQEMIVNGAVWDPLLGSYLSYKHNAGEAEIYAIELEALARPLQALTLNLTAALLDAQYTEFLTLNPDGSGQTMDLSGNTLPFSPKFNVAMGAQYVFDFDTFGFITVRGDVTWQDEIYFNEFNSDISKREDLTLINGFVRYETMDAYLSIEIYGKNLTGEEYYSNMFPGATSGLSGNLGTPRTFGLRVVYSF